jgi:hypothetical protein
VRLFIIGSIVVKVPFFMPLLFKTLALLAMVFDPVVCNFAVDDVHKSQSSWSRLQPCSSGGMRLLAES